MRAVEIARQLVNNQPVKPPEYFPEAISKTLETAAPKNATDGPLLENRRTTLARI